MASHLVSVVVLDLQCGVSAVLMGMEHGGEQLADVGDSV
jgi:hypothetical protein